MTTQKERCIRENIISFSFGVCVCTFGALGCREAEAEANVEKLKLKLKLRS